MVRHWVLVACFVVALPGAATAERIAIPTDRSSSDRLLEEPEAPATPKPSAKDSDAPRAGESPLARIQREMREAERGLAAGDAGESTQAAQRRAVDQLDQLIRDAARTALPSPTKNDDRTGEKGGPPPTDGNPTSPPGETDPVRKHGAKPPEPDRAVARPNPRTLLEKVWGHLPQKEREERMTQFAGDRFLPKYELEIEQYFQRLVEDRRE